MNKRLKKKVYKKSIYRKAEQMTFKSEESKAAWINDEFCRQNTPATRKGQLSKYFMEGY